LFRRWYRWYKAWGWIPCALVVVAVVSVVHDMLSGDRVDWSAVVAAVLGLTIAIVHTIVSRRSTELPENENG